MKKLLDYVGWLLLTAATIYHFVFEESDVGNNLAIIPEIGAALIGAGGSLFSSLFGGSSSASSTEATNQMNLKIARENNQFNAEQAQINRDWQEKMWNAQNAYNDPKAAAMRSIAAGINPYIDEGSAGSIISNGAANSAGSGAAATAAAAPQMVAPNYDFVGQAVQAALGSISQAYQNNAVAANTAKILNDIAINNKDYSLRERAQDMAEALAESTKQNDSVSRMLMANQISESDARVENLRFQNKLAQSGIRLNDIQVKSIQNDLDNFAENLALRWFEAKTGRMNVSVLARQVQNMVDRLDFEKNYGISDLSPEDRKKLSKELRLYTINNFIRLTSDERYLNSDWSRWMRLGNPLSGSSGVSGIAGTIAKFLK